VDTTNLHCLVSYVEHNSIIITVQLKTDSYYTYNW